MREVDAFENNNVSMRVVAVAALHEFEVALSDNSCPGTSIFLSVGNEFKDDETFLWMMKQLYPGYPSDDAYRDIGVPINVKGTVVRKQNRNLLMTYLELKSIER